jgi:hypothetical protein
MSPGLGPRTIINKIASLLFRPYLGVILSAFRPPGRNIFFWLARDNFEKEDTYNPLEELFFSMVKDE